MPPIRTIIMGAAGRDFHNFNVFFRDNPDYEVVAFTATQIPDIEGRVFPAELAGSLYPKGIPIRAEEELADLIRTHKAEQVIFAYSDVTDEYVMHKAAQVNALGGTQSPIILKRTASVRRISRRSSASRSVTAFRRVSTPSIICRALSSSPFGKWPVCDSDRAVIANYDDPKQIMAMFTQAFTNGPHGVVTDYASLARSWECDLSAVTIPVTIFQGTADKMVPFRHAEQLTARLPKSTLKVWEGEGHLATVKHVDEILAGDPAVRLDQERHRVVDAGEVLTGDQMAALDRASAMTPIYPYWHQRGFADRNPPPV